MIVDKDILDLELSRVEHLAKTDPTEKAMIAQLKALQAAIQTPGSLASFGMRCIDQANLPASTWADRKQSQQLYEELLADPRLT